MEKKGAQVLAISVDDVETLKRFKAELKLPYTLLSDEGGKVADQYGGKIPVLGVANRASFVVDQDGTVKEIATGSDALDPTKAIAACPARKGPA